MKSFPQLSKLSQGRKIALYASICIMVVSTLLSTIGGNFLKTKAAVSANAIINPQLTGFFSDTGAINSFVATNQQIYTASSGFGLTVLNAYDPSLVGIKTPYRSQRPPSPANYVAVSDYWAATASATNGLSIVYLGHPMQMPVYSNIPGNAGSLVMKNNYIYYISENKLNVVDIQSPSSPVVVTKLPFNGGILDQVTLSGGKLLVTENKTESGAVAGYVNVVDIGTPSAPVVSGKVTLDKKVHKALLTGNTIIAELTAVGDPIKLYDISNIASPKELSSVNVDSRTGANGVVGLDSAADIAIKDSNLYAITQYNGMMIINISNPSAPTVTKRFGAYPSAAGETYPDWIQGGKQIQVDGDTAFVLGNRGILSIDIGSEGPRRLYETNAYLGPMGYTGEGMSSYGKLGMVNSNLIVTKAYAQKKSGTAVVNISNKEMPRLIQFAQTKISTGVTTYKSNAYVTDSDGVKVLNYGGGVVKSIPAASASYIANNGKVIVYTKETTWNAWGSPTGNKINIDSISDPASPATVKTMEFANSIASDVLLKDNYMFVKIMKYENYSLKPTDIQVFDITDPANPRQIATIAGAGNGAMTIDGNNLYVVTGLNKNNNKGVTVYDISSPASPSKILNNWAPDGVGYWNVSKFLVSDGTAYVTGGYKEFLMLNFKDVTNPGYLGKVTTLGSLSDLLVAGSNLYGASSSGLVEIFNLYGDQIKVTTTANTKVKHGDQITYTVTIENTSPNTLTNIAISNPVPTKVTYTAGSASNSGTYDSQSRKVNWTVGEMKAAQKTTVTFSAKVN